MDITTEQYTGMPAFPELGRNKPRATTITGRFRQMRAYSGAGYKSGLGMLRFRCSGRMDGPESESQIYRPNINSQHGPNLGRERSKITACPVGPSVRGI